MIDCCLIARDQLFHFIKLIIIKTLLVKVLSHQDILKQGFLPRTTLFNKNSMLLLSRDNFILMDKNQQNVYLLISKQVHVRENPLLASHVLGVSREATDHKVTT